MANTISSMQIPASPPPQLDRIECAVESLRRSAIELSTFIDRFNGNEQVVPIEANGGDGGYSGALSRLEVVAQRLEEMTRDLRAIG